MNSERQQPHTPPEQSTEPASVAEADISQYAVLRPWTPSQAEETPAPQPIPLDEDDAPQPRSLLDYIPALGGLGAILLATCLFMLIGGPAPRQIQASSESPPPEQTPTPAEPEPASKPEENAVFGKNEPGLRVLSKEEKAAMRRLELELAGGDFASPTDPNPAEAGGAIPATQRNFQTRLTEQQELQESYSATYWQRLQGIVQQEKTLLQPLPANPGSTKAKPLLDQRAGAANRTLTQLDSLQPQFVDPQLLTVAARVRNWYLQSGQLVAEGRSAFAQGGAPLAEWHQRDAAHRQNFQALLSECETIRSQMAGKYRQGFGRLDVYSRENTNN